MPPGYVAEHSAAICVQLETTCHKLSFHSSTCKAGFHSQQHQIKSFGEKLIEVENVSYLSYCKLNSVDPDVRKGWSILECSPGVCHRALSCHLHGCSLRQHATSCLFILQPARRDFTVNKMR